MLAASACRYRGGTTLGCLRWQEPAPGTAVKCLCQAPGEGGVGGDALGGGGHARDAAVAEPARQEVKPEVADGLGQVGVLQAPARRADAKLSSPGLHTGSRHPAGLPACLLASGAFTRSRSWAESLGFLVASGASRVTNNRLCGQVGVLQAHQTPAPSAPPPPLKPLLMYTDRAQSLRKLIPS